MYKVGDPRINVFTFKKLSMTFLSAKIKNKHIKQRPNLLHMESTTLTCLTLLVLCMWFARGSLGLSDRFAQ